MKKLKAFAISKFLVAAILIAAVTTAFIVKKTMPATKKDILVKSNLVAWCIVPFDSKKRNPEERAQMLNRLGITKLAYDWREEHIPTFDTEIQTMKKHHIKLQSFWLMAGADPKKEGTLKILLDAFKRNHVAPEIWLYIAGIQDSGMAQAQRIAAYAKPVQYIAEEAAKIGCKVGLYNHDGWYGEPENQLAIIDLLKMPNIGMVYNFHHAEYQVDRFPEFFPKILPHLLGITISGLQGRNPAKVVPIGEGNQELGMMRIVKESSYSGPINILNEDTRPDAEEGLQVNMDGFKNIVKALGGTEALRTYEVRKQ